MHTFRRSARPPVRPVDSAHRPAQRRPTSLIYREGNGLFTAPLQERSQDRAHACRLGGVLELHCSVDPIGVGAGEGIEAALDGGLDQRFGAGGAEPEREVGMEMEVSEHVEAD